VDDENNKPAPSAPAEDEADSFFQDEVLKPSLGPESLPLADGKDGEICDITDRWEVFERIGEGGMGVVYKGRHKVMGKIVAVKILMPHLTARSVSLRRFQQEAQAVSALEHPNVIDVLDCGLTPNGQAYQVMDYIKGISLTEAIHSEGKLPPERSLGIFMQICSGLAHAHSRNILHRDLKPSNIMLVDNADGKDHVRIVDFGLAKLLQDEMMGAKQSLTQSGEVFGSPLYMSPEQCTGGKLDERSDIYSMGCLMYETLTGEPPIVGANVLDTMQRQLTDEPKPFATTSDDSLLIRLNEIVLRCLSKERDLRYANATELKDDLHLALDAPVKTWKKESSAAKNAERIRRETKKHKSRARDLTIPFLVSLIAMSIIIAWSFSARTARADNIAEYVSNSLWNERQPKVTQSQTFEADEKNAIKGLGIIGQTEGVNSPLYTSRLVKLAEFYMANGRWADAQRQFAIAVKLMTDSSGGVASWDLADVYTKSGICSFNQGQMRASQMQLQQALKIIAGLINDTTNQSEMWKTRETLEYLEAIYSKENNLQGAATRCQEILQIYGNSANNMQERAFWTSELADIARRRAEFSQSERFYRQAVELWSQLEGSQGPDLAKAEFGLGLALEGTGDYKQAAALFGQALPVARANLGYDDILALAIANRYSAVLWKCDPVRAVIMKVSGTGS
jgi:serine/threonine protein kinase